MKKFNKMEKWLFGVMGLFCGFAIALGLSISGIKCFAEDVEASAESVENYDYFAVGNTYYIVSEQYNDATARFTILENNQVKIELYNSGALLATLIGQYDSIDNKIAITAADECMGKFTLFPDGRAVEIFDDTATDEEVIDGVENGENSAEIEGILNAVQEYLDSKKDEDGNVDMGAILTDAKTWVIAAISWIMSTFGGAMIAGALNRINKKKDVLSEAQIEKVANAAAKASTEKLIGKSIDVDISAEVSKAVKQELSALNNSVNSLVDGVKNAEMLSAEVAMAQSRSRLLTDEERHALRDAAAKVQEHAGKKVISAPKVKIKTKTEKVESAPAVTEDVTQKNMYFINFDGVEKK